MNTARRDEAWLQANRPSRKPFSAPANSDAGYDHINPDHYKGGRKYEPIDVIEDWELCYHLASALKYISRNGRKPGEDRVRGLKKAVWFLERKIEKIEGEELPFEDRELDDNGILHSVIPGSDEDTEIIFYDDEVIDDLLFAGNYEGPLYARHPELKNKDLDQFTPNEIVRSVIHKDGSITGTRRDGSTTVLRHAPGTYEAFIDTLPSEFEP